MEKLEGTVTDARNRRGQMTPVQYPEMRSELIQLLEDVVNPSNDAKWTADPSALDEWFNSIEDVMPQGPFAAIGFVLEDEREAQSIAPVVATADAVFKDVGDASYEAYTRHPKWSSVVQASREALEVLTNSDQQS